MYLEQGLIVDRITWPDESTVGVGSGTCKSLVIAMQPGQMGMVPWVLAKHSDGSEYLHNAAELATIKLATAGDRESP